VNPDFRVHLAHGSLSSAEAVRPDRLTEDAMNHPLIKALIAFLPTGMLFSGSIVLFLREKRAPSFLQLCGAGCLVLVVLTHVSEALHLLPWMHWGLAHSVGHYLDFWSAVLGFTLFPIGYLLQALTERRA
jgi:hypothetical protein